MYWMLANQVILNETKKGKVFSTGKDPGPGAYDNINSACLE